MQTAPSSPVLGPAAARIVLHAHRPRAVWRPAKRNQASFARITRENKKLQGLRGITRSGKTYTMAKIIKQMQRPALVLSHNKTLAAQLYREFKEFFPSSAVEYFVSYYDYHQLEAYVPGKDLFIEKDASVNSEIEKLRLAATACLYSRRDVVIVATVVSCIFGLGSPEDYARMAIAIQAGDVLDILKTRAKLAALQYERNDSVLERGRFRVQDSVLDIYPAYEDCVYRVRTEWDVVQSIEWLHAVTFEKEHSQDKLMYSGDRARKVNLVEYGFRLPSACDNRPLKFYEFEQIINQCIFVSATPRHYELSNIKNPKHHIVEQIIRPTGLLDPLITVHKTEGQIDHLLGEIRARIAKNERVLITVLTKRMAEHISDDVHGLGIKIAYLHSEIDTIERVEVLVKLRAGHIDAVVGINLLREGLDLPEISLVAILDADKIGFLRSATSLIQTISRAARTINGQESMYADAVTDAMRCAIEETERRRVLQDEYNKKHGITPAGIKKAVKDILMRTAEIKQSAAKQSADVLKAQHNLLVPKERRKLKKELTERMNAHSEMLEFEESAVLRDEIIRLKEKA